MNGVYVVRLIYLSLIAGILLIPTIFADDPSASRQAQVDAAPSDPAATTKECSSAVEQLRMVAFPSNTPGFGNTVAGDPQALTLSTDFLEFIMQVRERGLGRELEPNPVIASLLALNGEMQRHRTRYTSIHNQLERVWFLPGKQGQMIPLDQKVAAFIKKTIRDPKLIQKELAPPMRKLAEKIKTTQGESSEINFTDDDKQKLAQVHQSLIALILGSQKQQQALGIDAERLGFEPTQEFIDPIVTLGLATYLGIEQSPVSLRTNIEDGLSSIGQISGSTPMQKAQADYEYHLGRLKKFRKDLDFFARQLEQLRQDHPDATIQFFHDPTMKKVRIFIKESPKSNAKVLIDFTQKQKTRGKALLRLIDLFGNGKIRNQLVGRPSFEVLLGDLATRLRLSGDAKSYFVESATGVPAASQGIRSNYFRLHKLRPFLGFLVLMELVAFLEIDYVNQNRIDSILNTSRYIDQPYNPMVEIDWEAEREAADELVARPTRSLGRSLYHWLGSWIGSDAPDAHAP